MSPMELQRLVEAVTREVWARLGADPGTAAGEGVGGVEGGALRDDGAPRRRPLVAANWKMNACRPDLRTYLAVLEPALSPRVDVLLIPPAVLIPPTGQAVSAAGLPQVEVGAQDLHWEDKGAHTGELSGTLLAQAGARWTLVGHSERRAAGETDGQVARKIRAGWQAGLSVMLCVGERLDERRAGATFRVLRQQLQLALAGTGLEPPAPHRLAVAYEPVWAIGSGERATPDQIDEAAAFIRRVLAERYDHARARRLRVLYGGSVKPETTLEVLSLPEVDGVLVGGASLEGRSLAGITRAAHEAATTAAATSPSARDRRTP